jgi:hypothetical protein
VATEEQRYQLLVDTYADQQAHLLAALLKMLFGVWVQFPWFGRPDMVNAAAAASAAHVDAATKHARRLSRAFMLRQLEMLDATPDVLPPIEDIYPRSGTPIVEVYKRPARQVEHLIRERQKHDHTDSWTVTDEEWKQFEERLTSIVSDDLAATARDEAQKVMRSAPKVIGYRRVIHPEFSKTGVCGLCVVASSRYYTKDELLPLHANCKCTISPLTATQDLGQQLNREDLDALYKAAGSNYAEDLKKITVEVRENGELGPILTRTGEAFRGVAQANRDSKRQTFTPYKATTPAEQRDMWAAQLATAERGVRILQDAKRNGTNLVDMTGTGRTVPVKDIDKAIGWYESLISKYTANLA